MSCGIAICKDDIVENLIIEIILHNNAILRKKGMVIKMKNLWLWFHPFPLESAPHRFVCANIAIKPPDDTVIFVRTYHGITPNILLTQYIPRLPAGARLPACRTLRSAQLFRPLFLLTQQTFRAFSSVILKLKTKNALAGAFSAVTCSQNSLVLFERIFRDWSHLFFLLSLVRFLSSFSEKRRKK